MKIKLLSDLHIDKDNINWVIQQCNLNSIYDILVLAGDIFNDVFIMDKFFKCVPNNVIVLYIPGNHEYYYNSNLSNLNSMNSVNDYINKVCGQFKNVVCMTNKTYTIKDITFIGCIMWPDINALDKDTQTYLVKRYNDFRYIKVNNDKIMTPKDMSNLHTNDLSFLKQEVAKNARTKKFVITHFAPSILLYNSKYKNSDKRDNHYFYNDLRHLFPDVMYWVSGHTHTTATTKVTGCKLYTNTLGYAIIDNHIFTNENKLYDKNFIIDI